MYCVHLRNLERAIVKHTYIYIYIVLYYVILFHIIHIYTLFYLLHIYIYILRYIIYIYSTCHTKIYVRLVIRRPHQGHCPLLQLLPLRAQGAVPTAAWW